MVKYNNTPIIEAVCEFRFSSDTNWDLTTPGIMYGEIHEEFPHIEQHALQDINLLQDASVKGTRINTTILARFLSEDKKKLIQVGPRILSINRLKPYHSWSDFKSQINYAFQKLNERVELKGVQRIGLRYVNKIEIPTEQGKVDLEKYFDFRPFCGPNLPQSHANFIAGCLFTYSDERDRCQVQLTDATPEIENALAFLLSIDYFLAKPQSIPITQSMDWIEEAHGVVENLFEGCILPPLREIFCKEEE
ncbi:MAG: TIGR04255 family protein [Methanothrix sp.]|nr:TIGR04255 family protein [Methanothrix sp.]